MNRRTFIASVTGLATSSGCLEDTRESTTDEDDTDVEIVSNPTPPFEVTTVDAPGSEAGTMILPQSDQPMLVNLAQTTCFTCQGMIPTISDAIDRLEEIGYDLDSESPDVRFLTVVDPTYGASPSPDELADWWVEHGGHWHVGLDERGALRIYYEVDSFPTTIVIDDTGEVHRRTVGETTAGNVVSSVESATRATNDQHASETGREARANASTDGNASTDSVTRTTIG